MIVVVDYGMGNLGSIQNMLKRIGVPSQISSDPSVIRSAEKLILPGIGAFDNGMRCLEERGLIPVLNEKALQEKTPILGVCLGMQLMTKSSEEGNCTGLGWVEADTKKFHFNGETKMRIPHIGWNVLGIVRKAPLFENMFDENRFYFVHSYHVVARDPDVVSGRCQYGYDFVASFQKNNIYGVQFHPEKSHKFGMRVYRNFAAL